jgi:hypothetical protein
LSLAADAVCGSICVDDWAAHPQQVRDYFRQTYVDADGHRHVHGANLGVSAQAYRRAGGFAPLACSEDVALVEQLQASGACIAWSAAPRVVTSARRASRARGGFGDTLSAWGVKLAEPLYGYENCPAAAAEPLQPTPCMEPCELEEVIEIRDPFDDPYLKTSPS